MGRKTRTTEQTPEDFEGLEQQVYEAFLARGWIIPQTEGDVSRAEVEMASEEDQELPAELNDPYAVLKRASQARPKVVALNPTVNDTPELLARAAREGKDIPPDIEELMRNDREVAERKAENDH